MNLGQLPGLAWDLAAWFLVLSAASAGVIGLVCKARARGRRLFRDEPLARVHALRRDTTNDHIYDGA
jgi:hypothetical protein